MVEFKITSPEFENNKDIPKKFTCQGQDINPILNISGVPNNAVSLALIVDDPDAPMGTWDHWIVWSIDPKLTKIDENSIPKGCIVGKNSWGKNIYQGPCPPFGKHRYFFKLFALDTKVTIDKSSNKKKLEDAMKEHIIAKTELIGLYQKSK